MNAIDVMGDILMFRGFWKSPFKDKLKWLFILYPFFLGVLLVSLVWYATFILFSLFRRR